MYRLRKENRFIFTAEVAVKPEVTLRRVQRIEGRRSIYNRSNDRRKLTQELKKKQEKNARTVAVDRPSGTETEMKSLQLILKDLLTAKHSKAEKERTIRLTIGSGAFIPGFEDQLIGAKAGRRDRSQCDIPRRLSGKRIWQEKKLYSSVQYKRSK